jgi:hypothetical protein
MEKLEQATAAILDADFSDWPDFDMREYAEHYDVAMKAWIQMISPNDKITNLGVSDGFINTKPKRFAKAGRVNRILVALSDIEPLPIPGFTTIDDYFIEGDHDNVWSQPHNLNKLEGDVRELALARAEDEQSIFHIMAFPQTLAVYRMAAGWAESRTNPILRMMRQYLKDVFNDEEPFREGARGIAYFHSDLAAPKRFLVLLNLFGLWQDFADILNEGVMIQVATYLFANPDLHSSNLKSMTSILKQSAFCLSKAGVIPVWYGNAIEAHRPYLEGYSDGFIEGADEAYWSFVRSKAVEDADHLRKAGLGLLADEWIILLSAEASRTNIRKATMYESLTAMTGFSRSEILESHAQQVGVEDIGKDFVPAFKENLQLEWKAALDWGKRNNKIPDYNTFVAQVVSFLTSRSAGGDKTEISVKVKDFGGVRVSKDESGEGVIRHRFTDKTMNFFSNPERYLDPDQVRAGYTELQPGGVGLRRVAGSRQTRAIFMRRLAHYLHEAPIAVVGMDHQQSNTKDDHPLGTPNDFTLGTEKGVILFDHWSGFLGTTQSLVYIDGADFSSFDATQHEANVRKWIREAVIDKLRALGFVDKWGPFSGGLPEVMEILWGKDHTIEAVFKSEGVRVGGEKRTLILKLDMLQSGELMTITINNYTNRANTRTQIDVMAGDRLYDRMSLLKVGFMGDDSIKYWRVGDVNSMTPELYASYVTMAGDVAKSNGLDLNPYKSVLRRTYYEYLKKKVIHGMYVPLLHIQLASSERPPKDVFPVEQVRSYASTTAAYIFRGGNEQFRHRVVHYTWRVRGSIKMPVSAGQNQFYYLPMAAIWTPSGQKGLGQLPWTSIGASKDFVIAIECMSNQSFRDLIGRAAFILAVDESRVAKDLARRIVDGADITPRNAFSGGIQFVSSTMPKDRIQAAIRAKRALDSIGAPSLDDKYYPDLPRVLIEKAIAGNTNLKKHDALRKLRAGRDYIRKQKQSGVKDPIAFFPWIRAFTWEDGELIPHNGKQSTPFPALQGFGHDAVMRYGVASDRSAYELSGNDFLTRIRNMDPLFPRHIQPEAIFGYITNATIIQSPRNVINALVAMGARSDVAAKVANELDVQGKSFAFRQNAKAFSLNDTFIPNLDLSLSGHQRAVTLTPMPDRNFEFLVYEVGMLLSITRGYRGGGFRKVIATPGPDTFSILHNALLGKHSEGDVLRFQQIYASKTVDKFGQGS